MTSLSNLPEYKYRTKDLIRVLLKTGFTETYDGAYQKLHRFRRDGKFTPPQMPAEERGDWAFTEKQLIEIAKAFGPGGKGEWHFVR